MNEEKRNKRNVEVWRGKGERLSTSRDLSSRLSYFTGPQTGAPRFRIKVLVYTNLSASSHWYLIKDQMGLITLLPHHQDLERN